VLGSGAEDVGEAAFSSAVHLLRPGAWGQIRVRGNQ
jgi:hypothetical protein